MWIAPALCILTLQAETGVIVRDKYGVPQIRADSSGEGFFLAGLAVAQDRLWQMELSRRIARGRTAALLGEPGLASDIEYAKTGYTDAEIQAQFNQLPKKVQGYFRQYAAGVNEWIRQAKAEGKLPPGYAQNGVDPEPWDVLDSAAIAIRLAKMFGAGGAGELRNYLLVTYLKGQKCGPQTLDVVDDFSWHNDPAASCTLSDEDDPLAGKHPEFPGPTRAETEASLKALPPSNLFELASAMRLAAGEATTLVAQNLGVAYKTGSYAIVVGPSKSANGLPILASGPQMGHSIPSIVHEMSIKAGDIHATGMDLPGLPGILIGTTQNLAWGFTSGVADVSDIFFFKRSGASAYQFGDQVRPLAEIKREIKVRGKDSVHVTALRTHWGPVVLESKTGNAVYVRRDAYFGRELTGLGGVYSLYGARTGKDADRAMANTTVTFNFFYAAKNGDIGWRYCGAFPKRAPGHDPRFPISGDPRNDWQGFLKPSDSPHVLNPKSGLLVNWNNKPVSWWPNWDTPVWGSIFRDQTLRMLVEKSPPPLGGGGLVGGAHTAESLIDAIRGVSKHETATSLAFLQPLIEANKSAAMLSSDSNLGIAYNALKTWDGWNLRGSIGARIYAQCVTELRKTLFVPHTGNFLGDANLNTVVQPSLMLRALAGNTKYNFLNGRTKDEILRESFGNAILKLTDSLGPDSTAWGFHPGTFPAPGGQRVEYNDRGTYIQIIELLTPSKGVNILPPGVGESGQWSANQVKLAQDWAFKEMWSP